MRVFIGSESISWSRKISDNPVVYRNLKRKIIISVLGIDIRFCRLRPVPRMLTRYLVVRPASNLAIDGHVSATWTGADSSGLLVN